MRGLRCACGRRRYQKHPTCWVCRSYRRRSKTGPAACAICGVAIVQIGVGRPRTSCSDHCRYMADRGSRRRRRLSLPPDLCVVCAAPCRGKRCLACYNVARAKKPVLCSCGQPRSPQAKVCRACLDASRRLAPCCCELCGQPFRRHRRGSDAKRFCRRDCAFAWQKARAQQRRELRDEATRAARALRLQRLAYEQGRREAERLSRKRPCEVCGTKVGFHRSRYCSTECSQAAYASTNPLPPPLVNCLVCDTPLVGGQRFYCSDKCHWRKRNITTRHKELRSLLITNQAEAQWLLRMRNVLGRFQNAMNETNDERSPRVLGLLPQVSTLAKTSPIQWRP